MSDPKQETKKPQETKPVGEGSWKDYGDIGVRSGNSTQGGPGGEKLPFFQMEEGRTYRIRLIGRPWNFFRHYGNPPKGVVNAISPGFAKDVVWQAGNEPRERYSVLIFDKTKYEADKDPGMGILKIFEGGSKIFGNFKSYKEMTGKDPGGKTAPEWLIQVKIPSKIIDGKMKKDKRSTEYTVLKDNDNTFTAEEMAYIEANYVDLKKQNKPVEPETLEEMFKDAKSRGVNDPIPGSKEWWKARREKRKGESGEASSSEEKPLVEAGEPEANGSAKSAETKTAGSNEGFGGLFDQSEDDKGKASTKF